MATQQTFKNLSNLPNVLGAIDRWHIKIKIPIESRPDYLVIAASCILRNYCGMLNDFFDDKWLDDVHILAGVCPGDPNQSQNTNAIAIRDAVKRLSM